LIELDFLHKITNVPKEIIRKNQLIAFQNWLTGFQNLNGVQGADLREKAELILENWIRDLIPTPFIERLPNLRDLGDELEYKIPLTMGTRYRDEILTPKTKEILEKLKVGGYQLYIASSAHTRHIRGILEGTGILNYFIQIYGFNNVGFMKSDKRFFQAIIVSLGNSPTECVMIGNSAQEILFSKDLGIKTILIKHELEERGEEEQLKKQALETADAVCETVEDILEILL
ncbi:MAG: HAD family hydrolase, partial [Promethearchaeota archaeon]